MYSGDEGGRIAEYSPEAGTGEELERGRDAENLNLELDGAKS